MVGPGTADIGILQDLKFKIKIPAVKEMNTSIVSYWMCFGLI